MPVVADALCRLACSVCRGAEMTRPVDQTQHLASGTDGERVRRESRSRRDVRGHVAYQLELRGAGLREQRDDDVFQRDDAHLQLNELSVAERRSARQHGLDIRRPLPRASAAFVVPALKRALGLIGVVDRIGFQSGHDTKSSTEERHSPIRSPRRVAGRTDATSMPTAARNARLMTSVPSSTEPIAVAELSPWWGRGVLFTLVFGFSVLILIAVTTYRNVPPIPNRAVTSTGAVLFTGEDIASGQEVFLKYGLMDNGSVWGHGAYLGPDFSASYLHDLAVDVAEQTALARFGGSYAALADEDKSAVAGIVASRLRRNGYDPSTGVLTLAVGDHGFFDREQARWARYFEEPSKNGGLRRNAITNPTELHALNAFFAWAAWASVAERPGTDHSYTNNFPYDRLAGNVPTASTLVWSAVSIIFLLCATGLVLLAFGFFSDLGWHGDRERAGGALQRDAMTPNQRTILKLIVVAAFLFLAQAVIGGGCRPLPRRAGRLLRLRPVDGPPEQPCPHLASAARHLLDCDGLCRRRAVRRLGCSGRSEPPGSASAIHLLFGATRLRRRRQPARRMGRHRCNGWATLWFWIGNQGWEYLELGRAWQILLAIGLVFWFWPAVAQRRAGVARPERRGPFASFFLIAAAAIPGLLPAGALLRPADPLHDRRHVAVLDHSSVGRRLLRAVRHRHRRHHLLRAGLVERDTALRVIYLDLILYFGGGLIGTGHHWYFNGQTDSTWRCRRPSRRSRWCR